MRRDPKVLTSLGRFGQDGDMTATSPSAADTPAADSPVRQLAQALVDRLLAADPFTGTGARPARVRRARAGPVGRGRGRAGRRSRRRSPPQAHERRRRRMPPTPSRSTSSRATCERRRRAIAMPAGRVHRHARMPIAGPPALFAVLARTRAAPTRRRAADYLTRVRASAGWLDAYDRAAARGRGPRAGYPVGVAASTRRWRGPTGPSPSDGARRRSPPRRRRPAGTARTPGATSSSEVARDEIVPGGRRGGATSWSSCAPQARPDDGRRRRRAARRRRRTT